MDISRAKNTGAASSAKTGNTLAGITSRGDAHSAWPRKKGGFPSTAVQGAPAVSVQHGDGDKTNDNDETLN